MTGPVYVTDPPELRTTVPLESLVAVFHAPSGMTHLLAPPAPEILEALEQGPADAETILARLMMKHEVDASDARSAIIARLDELEAGGLVWRS